MPQGTPHFLPYSRCDCTAVRMLRSMMVSGKWRIQSVGIRYSNMVPLHESSTGSPRNSVWVRPRRNQDSCGISPLAMATKLAIRASDASRL